MAKESKHVAKFRAAHLKTGEAIKAFDDGYIGEAMGTGSKRQYNGSLIVTNERVAFYRKGLLGEVLETIPLKSITSIERKSLLGHRTIGIHTSHDALVFKTFNKDGETKLIDAIEDGRHSSSANTATQAKQESPLDQLKRLGELKEAGVITDEEFSSKKSELLEKI
jgi:hypothetical protein